MTIGKLPTSASLKQVMDKFEEISLQDFSNIDIVVKSELPEIVKEGQIVVLSDEVNNIYLSPIIPTTLKTNDIVIQILNYDTKYRFNINSKNIFSILYVYGAKKYINGELVKLDSFLGVNNKWMHMNGFWLYKNGNEYLENTETGISFSKSTNVLSSTRVDKLEDCIYVKVNNSSDNLSKNVKLYTEKVFDLSNFTRLKVKYDINTSGGAKHTIQFKMGASSYKIEKTGQSNTETNNYNGIIELDISNLTSGALEILIQQSGGNTSKTYVEAYIYEIWME